jgi:type II secretory pathway component PulK
MKRRAENQEQGVALIMVIFMVVLCSAILISLSDSTYTAMRVNRTTEQRVKAEYIMKSAVNFARVLIQNDSTQFDDPSRDDWMQFRDGREVPGELIGVSESNVRISLMIAPENAKIPLVEVVQSAGVDTAWRDILVSLFKDLGFDNPPTNNDPNEATPARAYSSTEMVANLIDYLDNDQVSYSDGSFQGTESELPQGTEFPNQGRIESLQSELTSIPGFTPLRVQQLIPYISIHRKAQININAAPRRVLRALIEGLDPTTAGGTAVAEADKLILCRDPANGGPYNESFRTQMSACITPSTAERIKPKLTNKASIFSVITKVEYGNTSFFSSAYLEEKNGRLPEIKDFLVY